MREVPAPRPPGAKAPAPAPRSRPKPHVSAHGPPPSKPSPSAAARRPDVEEEEEECPLCCTALDATDRRFKPCACGYQLCAWCWHQLMERAAAADAVGKCPACRAEYDERSIRFDAPSEAELAAETRKRTNPGSERSPNPKPPRGDPPRGPSGATARVAAPPPRPRPNASLAVRGAASERVGNSRRARETSAAERERLFDVRVIRRNLVYVVGLTPRFCEEAPLRETRIFQKFGEVLKIHAAPPKPGAGPATGSAYVTFADEAAAARCVREVDHLVLDGKTLRTSFGTTKYCASFLRGAPCARENCLYLHDAAADRDLSFAKEETLARYGSKNTRAFRDAARGGTFRSGAAGVGVTTERALNSGPLGSARGACVEPRSASRARRGRDRAAAGIKGGIPAPRPIPAVDLSSGAKTDGNGVENRSTDPSVVDGSSPSVVTGGLGVFGAGKPPAPAPRERSRFTFAAAPPSATRG